MSVNKIVGKEIEMHSYNWILPSNKNELTVATCDNINESQNNMLNERNKTKTILYNFIYIEF